MANKPDHPDLVDPALKAALRLLSTRGRTRHELQQALARRQHSPAATAAAIERVEALGYLDDAKYARARAEVLLRDGKLGPTGVQRHLKARGIAADLARTAVQQAEEALGFDPKQAAAALLARRGLLVPGKGPTEKERAKAARVLLARGFSASVAELLTGAALDSPPEDD